MDRTYQGGKMDLGTLSSLEDEMAAQLVRAADEMAHMEWDDDECRAEVYTIVEALKADGRAHRKMIDLVAHRLKGSPVDA